MFLTEEQQKLIDEYNSETEKLRRKIKRLKKKAKTDLSLQEKLVIQAQVKTLERQVHSRIRDYYDFENSVIEAS